MHLPFVGLFHYLPVVLQSMRYIALVLALQMLGRRLVVVGLEGHDLVVVLVICRLVHSQPVRVAVHHRV